jgi:fucokinase
LFEKVLHLEQMLTTGGGWQDQVGGLVPGVKLVSSGPGVPQRLKVEPVVLPPAVVKELHRRLVLVYVGHRRLAKNILRSVMGGWLAREPDVVWILGRIQEIARGMRAALLAGDLDWFGALMREHWELNKRLDPNSTNRHVEAVLAAAAPFASGFKMVGAGGGGFAEIVARGPREAAKIARAVAAAGGRAYAWSLARGTA